MGLVYVLRVKLQHHKRRRVNDLTQKNPQNLSNLKNQASEFSTCLLIKSIIMSPRFRFTSFVLKTIEGIVNIHLRMPTVCNYYGRRVVIIQASYRSCVPGYKERNQQLES